MLPYRIGGWVFFKEGYKTMSLIYNNRVPFTFVEQPPEPVGWWQITPDVEGRWCTRFAVYAPVDPKHIKNTEEMFGWKWIDGKAQEK